jgi:iron complex transport system substrate-binding protein
MLDDDSRYGSLKAWKTGQVWLYNRRANAIGANDYWSRGVTEPDRILADLIKIFYPELARDHEFEWYRQVPAN